MIITCKGMAVRYLKIIYLLFGLGLLGVIVYETDLDQVWSRVRQVEWGIAIIFGLYFVAFLVDTMTWQVTVKSVRLNGTWLYRLWKVRMVGEAFNTVTPLATMGGEPVKAVLLKKHHGIGYREAIASLVLTKTTNLIALVFFLGAGLVFMLKSGSLPTSYKLGAGIGLLVFTVSIILFFLVQRLKVSTRVLSWIFRKRFAESLKGLRHHFHDIEERLAQFYTDHSTRFAAALFLAFFNWVLGAVELYYTMLFLGHPISITDAWIIEAFAQLVRMGAFFIPASIGVQEGAFMLVVAALTGSPELGLAVAMVRRFREIAWILWGFALGWHFSFKPSLREEEVVEPTHNPGDAMTNRRARDRL